MSQPYLFADIKHSWLSISKPAYSEYYCVMDLAEAGVEPNTLFASTDLEDALQFVRDNIIP